MIHYLGGTLKRLIRYQGLTLDDQLENNTIVKLLDFKGKENIFRFSRWNYEIGYKLNRIRWPLTQKARQQWSSIFKKLNIQKVQVTDIIFSQHPFQWSSIGEWLCYGTLVTLYFSTWATQARFNCCLTQFLAEYPHGTCKDRQSCELLLYGLIFCGRLPVLPGAGYK